ncbi:cell wall-active antibiotics response protein LiaF [Sporolactobacillus shoreicorticis]|uniref:Cell wall-active antibiotics response protein LiaF n=1 Tax=Sporolactobacillus shoreicorticis TaxID=1923877 RepID=A0ABW5RXX0_9BACL|nr:cell wall-active antibiotics response protein LiaF [Sporolactobacillus shoreicorticis]MCO7124928.1 cell wall-active antibiotics response protein LiaF [Sporolactobacillus shoreicorticis]
MSFGKLLAALAVVLLGVYWLLDSLNLISQGMMPIFSTYFPFLAILFGVLLLVIPLFDRKKPHVFWGFLFLIYGGLLYAGQSDLIVFEWTDFWKLWPYLIIYFGLGMLFGKNFTVSVTDERKRHWRKHHNHRIDFAWDNEDDKDESSKNEHDSYKFVNDSTFKHDNWMVKPMNERVRIGDYTFDFTKAFIPEETIPITLSGWVGNIRITLPDDLAYRIHLRAKVGDAKIGKNKQSGVLRNVSYQTPNYDEATRKIDFNFDFQVIDLSIAQV